MPVYIIKAQAPRRSWIVMSGTNVQTVRKAFKKLLAAQRIGGDVLSNIDSDFKDELYSNIDVNYSLIKEDF